MFNTRVFAGVVFMLLLLPAAGAQALVVDGNRIMDQDMCENLCALTFDDGPSNYTPQLLDMLKQEGIPATFFVLGVNARRLPGVVRRIAAEGHEIGNHTYSHPNLVRLGYEQQKAQIGETEAILREIGVTSLYMRPPYGNYDARTLDILREHGLKLVMWSLDSYDWKRLPANYAKLRSTRGTVYEDGALRGVFLFHDIHKSTVDDFPRIIANLRAGGCQRFVTMTDYLAGVLDDEPCMLMTRRPDKATYAQASAPVAQEAPNPLSSLPLARCSAPYEGPEQLAHIDSDVLSDTDDQTVQKALQDARAAIKPIG